MSYEFVTNLTGVAPYTSFYDRPAATSVNNVPWRKIINRTDVVGGGPGGTNYSNEVVSVGWNLSQIVEVASNAAAAANYDSWESKFYPGGPGTSFQVERHHGMIDTTGTVHRITSWQAPWDGLGAANVNSQPAIFSFVVDQINFNNFANTQIINWNLFGNQGTLNNSFILNVNVNNYAPFRQKNAAGGAFLHLPWIDSNNNLNIEQPFICNVTPSSITNASALIEAASPSNGNSVVALGVSGAGVVTLTGYAASGAATGQWLGIDCFNNTAAGDAVLRTMHPNSGSGDAYVMTSIFSLLDWSFGADTDDSGAWKLTKASGLNANSILRVDPTSMAMAFTNPPVTPHYVVSGLPSASSVGQGARAIVTDATVTTFASTVAGTGTNIVPVYSDGTNWKIG